MLLNSLLVKKVDKDKKIVEVQIDRTLRSDVIVSSRCHFNFPTAIKVPPNLNDGTPFPTTYWLTCPMYNKKIGSLESEGLIAQLDNEILINPKLKTAWSNRQASYQQERDDSLDQSNQHVPTGGVGGATKSIKCLHSHTADEISTGKNPVGKIVLESIGLYNCEKPCIDENNYQMNPEWKVEW